MKLIIPLKVIEPIIILKKNVLVSSPELYLASSIVLETACTFCLANVNNNKIWYIPVYTGYGISFYLFPKCLDKFSLSTAYALWSGFGIILTFIFDILLKREIFQYKKIFGILSIVYGIYIIK
jgi:multidrug transporter EmrE-like cation transporter|tara:strand:+ start:736 stop:1104 length:369 start_codon:yes stop_codon:yes gene_type:complete